MNCEICFNPYDHSIHKPYVLSCPHTFCKFCVDLLTTNKCPTCNTDISIKNPNIALLNLIPESSYDKLKVTFHKTLIELTNIINTVNIKGEPKLCEYLEKILATRNIIKTETNKFIELVRSSELELLNQLIEIEKNVKDRLLLQTDWQQQIETEIKTNKLIVEKNILTNEELNDLVDDSNEIKRQLNEIQSEIEEFNDQIEFTLYEYVSFKDGLIGEIKTDKVNSVCSSSPSTPTQQDIYSSLMRQSSLEILEKDKELEELEEILNNTGNNEDLIDDIEETTPISNAAEDQDAY